MALHPQTRFLIPKHRRKGDYPFCQHEQHMTASEEQEGTVRTHRCICREMWANQWVVQSLLAANGHLPQPFSQWHPVPSPGVWPPLPGPLRLHRGCTRQGAIWLGFLVSWVWPTGTLAGAGSRTAVTRVCKKQTLSEHVSTLLPPMLGVNFSCLRHTLGL